MQRNLNVYGGVCQSRVLLSLVEAGMPASRPTPSSAACPSAWNTEAREFTAQPQGDGESCAPSQIPVSAKPLSARLHQPAGRDLGSGWASAHPALSPWNAADDRSLWGKGVR